MPTTNSSIQFKYGLQETFSNITKDSNTIYFITDTNRLFVGDSEYTRPVQHGSELPTNKNPANVLFVKETGTARELYYSKDGTAWDMIAYLPTTITGGVFGGNIAGTVAYGGTVKIPKVTVDNRGYVTAAENVTITLPTSDKVTTVTTSGAGNAITTGSISADGKTLTLTKGTQLMPVAGGTFTGAVTLAGAPTTDLNAATKKYVDDQIASSLSASDAMVLKGTIGTSGTVADFSSLNISSAVIGDTYKVITADTLPAENSFDSDTHSLTIGDLIVYMGQSMFIYIPSGNEDVTTVKVAGSGDTINVSTTAQTGNIVLGNAATKKVTTGSNAMSMNSWSGAGNDNVPTDLAVKKLVDLSINTVMPKTGGKFTGAVTLAGAPTTDLNAATKKYVDDAVTAATLTWKTF